MKIRGWFSLNSRTKFTGKSTNQNHFRGRASGNSSYLLNLQPMINYNSGIEAHDRISDFIWLWVLHQVKLFVLTYVDACKVIIGGSMHNISHLE